MDSWLVFRRDNVILNQWTKRNQWSFKWFSKRLSYGAFPSDKRSWMFRRQEKHSMGNCPPIFIETGLQQYSRGALLYSAHCSLTTPFVSDLCDVDVQSFAKCQRVVIVNDYRLPIGLQKLLQAPLYFLRRFCFARKRLDPLSGQVPHHDNISVIVSSSHPSQKILWSAVIKSPKFYARSRAPPMCLLHGALVIFGPQRRL